MGTCKPRFGVDFIPTARGMLTDDIRRDLKAMADFEFKQHPTIEIAPERLEILSAMVRQQVKKLLCSSK